jgi:tetratricopeptide (TPR) repeat protein
MRLPLGSWLVTGMISLSSAAAMAADTKTPFPPCTTAPTEADRKAAQGAFAAGQGSFNEADYATAITYWRDAYRRDCTAHALLLNLGRAYELKSDRSEAVNSLETYLQRKPDAPDADQIRRRIENLKSQMVAAAPAPTAAPLPPAAPAAVAPTPLAPDSDGARGPGATPLILAGAGGVIAIVGTVLLVSGMKKEDEAATQCPSRVNCGSVADDGNSARTQEKIGGTMIGVGGAAIAGGLIWFFVSSKGASAQATGAVQRASVSPFLGPGLGGVSLSASF